MTEDTGWKCKNCGNFNVRTDKCPKCGKPKSNSQTPTMSSREDKIPANICPICERNDKVEKVSIIYMNGSHDTAISVPVTEINTNSDGKIYSTIRHSQATSLNETKLARALRPPSKPEEPESPDFVPYFVGGVVSAGFGMLVGASAIKNDAGGFFGIIIGFGFAFLMYLISKARYTKKMKDYYKSSIFLSWKQSVEKWNSLYFCHRDGQVYMLGKQNSVPLERIAEILN